AVLFLPLFSTYFRSGVERQVAGLSSSPMEPATQHSGPDPHRAQNDTDRPVQPVPACIARLNLDACPTWEERCAVLQREKEALAAQIEALEEEQAARSVESREGGPTLYRQRLAFC